MTLHLRGRLPVAIASLAITATLGIGAAHAYVVTFDGLPDGPVPDGYGGITWNGQWTVYSEAQYPYTPESPPARVYTFSSTAPFDFSTPTVFDGAYFSGYGFATVQFDMFLDGTLVATSGVLSPSSTPAFLSSGYGGLVNEVEVISPSPDYYVMDNVTYGVPEPAVWALLLVGFGAIGGAIRQRRSLPTTA